MKTEALERLLIQTLRTELESIRSEVGAPTKWIYVDYPRLDAQMPRISLTLVSNMQEASGIGSEISLENTLGVREITSFEIDIWVHRNNRSTGATIRAGTALRDFLADEVVDVLLKQRAVLSASYDIYDIRITNQVPLPYEEDIEIFRKTVSFEITHLRTF